MAYPLDLSGAARCAAIKTASVILLIVLHGVDIRCIDSSLKSVWFKKSFFQNSSLSLLLRYSNLYRKVQNAPVPPRSFAQTGKNLAWHPKEYVITYLSAVGKPHYVKETLQRKGSYCFAIPHDNTFACVCQEEWLNLFVKDIRHFCGGYLLLILRVLCGDEPLQSSAHCGAIGGRKK